MHLHTSDKFLAELCKSSVFNRITDILCQIEEVMDIMHQIQHVLYKVSI